VTSKSVVDFVQNSETVAKIARNYSSHGFARIWERRAHNRENASNAVSSEIVLSTLFPAARITQAQKRRFLAREPAVPLPISLLATLGPCPLSVAFERVSRFA
jgi:hypothetical protein